MLLIVGAVASAAGAFALGLSILRSVRGARTQPIMSIAAIILSAATLIGGIVLVATAGRAPSTDRDQIPLSALPEAPASGGRQLRADRGAAAEWREVRWAPGAVRLEVPSDWRERSNDAAALDLRPADLTTFVRMKVGPSPAIAPEDFLRAARVQAASRLAGSRIVGYSVRTLGAASGVLSFERGKEDTKEQLVWTGIVPGKNQLLTIFLGSASASFAQVEPVLGAILESIRIE